MEMGGMFSVVKVREGLGANDYKDPGPYRHPQGTVAHEIKGKVAEAPRATAAPKTPAAVELNVIKPGRGPAKHKH
jgi:hypothetical protein